MGPSLRLGTIAGIALYVHWTFLFLIAWVAFANLDAGMGGIIWALLFVLAVFGCVVLHELGHALAARRWGIRTHDITLLPIGGVARLERMPDDPRAELFIAAAGPLVNVVIAAIIYLVLFLWPAEAAASGPRLPADPGGTATLAGLIERRGFWPLLAYVNLFLVGFNLVPAFPMDGGRVLRAALAHHLDYAGATRVAAGVGQVIAALFGFIGLVLGHPFLILIALFVFFGAMAEARYAQVRSELTNLTVRDAMITDFTPIPDDAPLSYAVERLLGGSQQDFPVTRGGQVVGVLTRSDLIRGLTQAGMHAPVSAVARRDCVSVEESDPLHRVFQRMQERHCPLVPVTRGGELVGILTLENVGEFVMVRSALRDFSAMGRRAAGAAGMSVASALNPSGSAGR